MAKEHCSGSLDASLASSSPWSQNHSRAGRKCHGTLPRTLHGGALTLVGHSAFAQFKYEEMLLGSVGLYDIRMTVGTVTAGLNGLLFQWPSAGSHGSE